MWDLAWFSPRRLHPVILGELPLFMNFLVILFLFYFITRVSPNYNVSHVSLALLLL